MNESNTPLIVDLSHRLDEATPPFPGDPPVEITVFDEIGRSGPAGAGTVNASSVRASLHCGTHMDAPFHFFTARYTIDRVPLEWCFGPAVLARILEVEAVEVEHLARFEERLRVAGRVVIDTGWHRRWKSPGYFDDHPVISADAARFLVQAGVRLVGVDFPSVDKAPFDTHRVFLGNDVLIVENLTNLDAVPSEEFHLSALPLRIGGRDASPVRAIAVVER